MKLYRNHYVGTPEEGTAGESLGYSWHRSKADAVRSARGRSTAEVAAPFVLATKKKNIVCFLNQFAGHPDNGQHERTMTTVPFGTLPPGAQYQRVDSHREIALCVKLRTLTGEWNSVYLSGSFAGGFCSTAENTLVGIVSVPLGETRMDAESLLLMMQPPGPERYALLRNGECGEFDHFETLTQAVTMAYVRLEKGSEETLVIEEDGKLLWNSADSSDALASLRTFAEDHLIQLPE